LGEEKTGHETRRLADSNLVPMTKGYTHRTGSLAIDVKYIFIVNFRY